MHAALAAGHRIAGYRLLRLIGQGAHGAVYLAEDSATALPVALKLVPLPADSADPSADTERSDFLRNARTAQRLRHPGIVALHAAGIDGSTGWLAMEPVPGNDLGRYTHARRLLPEPVVLQVAQRLALALAYAHGQGVVHRDLKPANVLVHWPSDSIKLADLGLARSADATPTGTGLVLGTPAYMAPEQLAGSVPTPQSDCYALGVMLFQLLTGQLPHQGDTMGDLLHRVATEPAPDLATLRPGLPPPLTALVAGLLAKRPARRMADGEALAQRLQAIASTWQKRESAAR